MKKRTILALTIFATLTLSACNFLPDINFGGDNQTSQTSSDNNSSSDGNTSSSGSSNSSSSSSSSQQTVVLESISLSGSYKTNFYVGDSFTFGGTVRANYSDNSSKVVTSSASFTGFNSSSAVNSQTITVTYSEKGVTKTTTYNVKINAIILSSITLSGSYKTSLYVDDSFTFGGTVTAHYNNSSTKNVTSSSSFSGYNMHTAGDYIVTVSYSENDVTKTTSYSLSVVEKGVISKTHLSYTYDDYMSNNIYRLDNCPLSGSPKLLIIPVWFTDSDTYILTSKKETVRSDIQKAYLGSNSETGWRSVKTYYEEESQNKMSLTGTVSGWYNCGYSVSEVGDKNNGQSVTTAMVSSAVDWYFDTYNTSDSKSNYDTNGDGYLDGVMLIYAAPDYASLSNSSLSNLWAYCFWTQPSSAGTASNPIPNVFFWASYDFMYNGSKAYTQTGKSSYGHGDTSHCNIDAHTFIHEMGHVLGLEDYYDYSDYNYHPAGGFSMQDYNVGGHDPYSVMAYGWADPYIPTESMTITINDFQSSHDLILLSNHSVTTPFDEYLLLELYTPTGLNELDSTYSYNGGYPKGPTTPGIRLWHVDARLAYTSDWENWYLTNNPTKGNVHHLMSNSYDGDHASIFSSDYYNYNILQLIRNDTYETYTPSSTLSSSSLFKQSNSFSQSAYSSQFVDGTDLNNGSPLGWTFTVNSLSSSSATITLTKTA